MAVDYKGSLVQYGEWNKNENDKATTMNCDPRRVLAIITDEGARNTSRKGFVKFAAILSGLHCEGFSTTKDELVDMLAKLEKDRAIKPHFMNKYSRLYKQAWRVAKN